MGLRTNSRKAQDNIKDYILSNCTFGNYNINDPETFSEAAKVIYSCFQSEKVLNSCYRGVNQCELFADWCAGLPSVFDTCYYYNRSAVDDLGDILEQTETERKRYSESEAETILTQLIYRAIIKEVQA